MHLILVILRMLFGWVGPSWSDSVPLAVGRNGRLVGRVQRPEEPTGDSTQAQGSQAPGLLSLLWRAVTRAAGWLVRRPSGRSGPARQHGD